MLRTFVVGLIGVALVGCSATVQSSSGQTYLQGYTQSSSLGVSNMDDEFIAAASVEPTLNFPAKFGIARVEGGQLTSIPNGEMEAWVGLAKRSAERYGEFVPMNLLVAELAAPRGGDETLSQVQRIIRKVRLGAARQHMDAVLIYEVYGTSNTKQNPLSVGDLTILGAYLLPGRTVEAVGHVEALLFDVKSGYPYIMASETVDRDALATGVRARSRGNDLKARAMERAVLDLAETIEPALEKLTIELTAQAN